MSTLPPQLEAEREALIVEIYAAFEGVTRDGGESWSEAALEGEYQIDREIEDARARDIDTSWTQLATDKTWNIGPGVGGFGFLDPIGFRYYLPAAMVRQINDGAEAYNADGLEVNLHPRRSATHAAIPLLNDRQRRCVARFIRFMIACEVATAPDAWVTDWREVYEQYWKQFE